MKINTCFLRILSSGDFSGDSISRRLGMLALCLLPTAASADLGLFVLGGAQTTVENFAPYITATGLSKEHVIVRLPNTNPFNANHLVDMNQYQNDLEKFLPLNSDGVVLFAYSGGGKFAARLALDNKSVRGIFLMDPVDGPPPFTNDELKFPTVLKSDTPKLDIPVFVVKSERGGLPGFLGVPCAPKGNGPDHFASFVNPSKLQFYTAPGASHLDFLQPPLKALTLGACARSEEEQGATRANALVSWISFWQYLNTGIESPSKAFLEPVRFSGTEYSRIDQLKTEVLAIAKRNNIRTDNLGQVRAELQPRLDELAKLNPSTDLNFKEILQNLDGTWHQLWTDNSRETSGPFKYNLARAYQVFNAEANSYMTLAESRIGPATTLNILNVSLKPDNNTPHFIGTLGKISFSFGKLPLETEIFQLIEDIKSGDRKTVGFYPAKFSGIEKVTLNIQNIYADETLYISASPRQKNKDGVTTDLYISERVSP